MDNAMKLDDKLAELTSSLEHKYPTIPSNDIKKLIRQHALPLLNGIHSVYQSKDGVLEIGKGSFPLMESASKTGSCTVWSGLSVWKKGRSVVYPASDVIYLVNEVHDIYHQHNQGNPRVREISRREVSLRSCTRTSTSYCRI